MAFGVSAGDGSGPLMMELSVPREPGLIAALGLLGIAHTHLEFALRYTVKTLTAGFSPRHALDATSGDRMPDLRKRVRQLFMEKKPTPTETARLDALLGEGRRLTEKRNDYLHAVYSVTVAGEPIIKKEDHSWGPAPTQQEVENVASEILALGNLINYERLGGFIGTVAKRTA